MSFELLNKEQVMKHLKSQRGDVVRLARTAYSAMTRLEELQERMKVFAEAAATQQQVDELSGEIARLREQLAEQAPMLTVFIHRDGKVLVCGEHGRQDLCLVHVPDLPGNMVDERQDVVLKQLKFLHREAFISGQFKVIGRGNVNQAMTLSQYQYIKAYRMIRSLADENAVLKALIEPKEGDDASVAV